MKPKHFPGSVSRGKCHPQRAGGTKRISGGVRKSLEKSFVARKSERAPSKFPANAGCISTSGLPDLGSRHCASKLQQLKKYILSL